MTSREILDWRGERIRLTQWRDDSELGFLIPVPGSRRPTPEGLRHILVSAEEHGFTQIVTSALMGSELDAYMAAGFEHKERLHLLKHDLHLEPMAPRQDLRRAKRSDRPSILEIDALTFDDFWRFDTQGLRQALAAAATSRFRVADHQGRVVGYAITGKTASSGYVQRLGVHPDFQGRGLGKALLLDSLHWLKRRHCRQASVNTQLKNLTALALYEHMGFVRQNDGLYVLCWSR
ncbi:MAG: GNAT family N-acetyltransferase [Acidimicrobiales bacterium]